VTGQSVAACEVRHSDLVAYDGRELLVIRTAGTLYREEGRPVAGLAIECRSGSARWVLYRQGGELFNRLRAGDGLP
jgi:hypothetical protein